MKLLLAVMLTGVVLAAGSALALAAPHGKPPGTTKAPPTPLTVGTTTALRGALGSRRLHARATTNVPGAIATVQLRPR